MEVKSYRRKQQCFQHQIDDNYNPTCCGFDPLSSDYNTSSVRTRTMSRKSASGCHNKSAGVIMSKIFLFLLVFVDSNFYVGFGSKHEYSSHNLRHSNHHHSHHPHHHSHHRHSETGLRTCSHRPPKPEEVRHTIPSTLQNI